MHIRKAVFPVAGMGTRFLPATKASPKEMLPVVDKPLIQYAVEEALSAGAQELIFITGRSKNAIMDHFDKAYELEAILEERNKEEMLRIVREIVPPGVTCVYIRQAEALGLGHAVACARAAIGTQDFCVILADDLIAGVNEPCMAQMRNIYEQYGTGVVAVQEVPWEEVSKYGVVDIKPLEGGPPGLGEIVGIVEKPDPQDAPSNLAVIGRYILTPHILDLLENQERGAGNEIQLTDAIAEALKSQTILAYPFQGVRYDCGSKIGYLQANVELGLAHPECGADFANYLRNLSQDERLSETQKK
ncbi:MAG: UTP--glucose-1-phosphate uridylyltransferase GalU [Salinisphaeraceae bacterium]|nr:UTP--glucose-1-phosphate uridylyltransferase GalU [Salinisphaeraceae bacterium]